MRIVGPRAGIAGVTALLGLACGSSLPTGTQGSAGTGGAAGAGAAGTAGTGTAGTAVIGDGGSSDCSAPEVFSPGACSATYAEQVARLTCTPGHPVSTGFCAGFRFTYQGASWIMDILDGDQITCVYQPDGVGQLVGERIGTTDGNPACPRVGALISIHTSGFVPLDMNTNTCPADAGVAGGPAFLCPADGGAPG